MFALMKRLSTAVRQLAERHARFKGTAIRLEARLAQVQVQLEDARSKRDAAGLLLTRLEERVRLNAISPISEHNSAYGKRGSFHNAALELLRAESPRWVSTSELSQALEARFGLIFDTLACRAAWGRTLRTALSRLVARGVLERLREGQDQNNRVLWRVKQEAGAFSLADLRALVGADGSPAGV